jgi:diguanylate cyclase (GGDEF)-like protein
MNCNILVVDDDPITIQLLGHILSDLGTLRFATSGEDAVRLARESSPDLMLLDLKMPGMSGLRVCAAFKADPALADVPVLIVTSHGGAELEGILLEMGAADFIAKPFDAPLIRARVETHLRDKRMKDERRSIDLIDVQTGVASRRRFDESLEQEWSRARRVGTALALLMIEVDHFQSFDERYGGPGGGACLQSVAQALKGVSQRPADLVARYGSDAFVVLLPHTPRGGAEHMAREILAAVAALGIAHGALSVVPSITVSVGVACYEASDRSIPPSANMRHDVQPQALCSAIDLVRTADHALSSAKNAGGNQARLLDVVDVAASPAP